MQAGEGTLRHEPSDISDVPASAASNEMSSKYLPLYVATTIGTIPTGSFGEALAGCRGARSAARVSGSVLSNELFIVTTPRTLPYQIHASGLRICVVRETAFSLWVGANQDVKLVKSGTL